MLRLKQAVFGKGIRLAIANDKVIQHPDLHQGQGFFQFFGDLFVRDAGFGNAGRMVMGENDGCGIVVQGLFYDFRG